jgi:SpoVK/Ycf46/Vps4 family AAA+-type ATPase
MNRPEKFRRVIKGKSPSDSAIVHVNTLSLLGVVSGDTVMLSVSWEVGIEVRIVPGSVERGAILLPGSLASGHEGQDAFLTKPQQALPDEADNGVRARAGEVELFDETEFQIEVPTTTFEDVAGMDEVKNKIRLAAIYPDTYAEEYRFYGVRAGGGMILYGPPGCGKTLMASATAGEADANFLYVKGSNIKDMYVGNTEKQISRIFNLARQETRNTIIFIDEIDTVIPARGDSASEHGRNILGSFLSEMQGLEEQDQQAKYLVLVATNRPWELDPALRDRFKRGLIFVPHPDGPSRRRQFEISLGKKDPDAVDSQVLNKKNMNLFEEMTRGLSGRAIENLIERASEIPLENRINGIEIGKLKLSEKRPPISVANFKQAISEAQGAQNELPGWYRTTVNELEQLSAEERGLFGDLIRIGHEYLDEHEGISNVS